MGNSGVKVVDCCSKPVEKIGEFCKDGEFVKMENNFVKMENNFVKMENLASEHFHVVPLTNYLKVRMYRIFF